MAGESKRVAKKGTPARSGSARVFASANAFIASDAAETLREFAERVLAKPDPSQEDRDMALRLAGILNEGLDTRERRERAVAVVKRWLERCPNRRTAGEPEIERLGLELEPLAGRRLPLERKDADAIRGLTGGRPWEATRVLAWLALRFGILDLPKAKGLSFESDLELRNATDLLRQSVTSVREKRNASIKARR